MEQRATALIERIDVGRIVRNILPQDQKMLSSKRQGGGVFNFIYVLRQIPLHRWPRHMNFDC